MPSRKLTTPPGMRRVVTETLVPDEPRKPSGSSPGQFFVCAADPASKLPDRSDPCDAGWDFYAAEPAMIPPNTAAMVSLGVRVAVPDGYALVLKGRSGHAAEGIDVLGGVIDSGYRGVVKAILANFGAEAYFCEAGEKLVQGLIVPVPSFERVVVETLPGSDRGERGFGSSGR